jgi:hypothetical protein
MQNIITTSKLREDIVIKIRGALFKEYKTAARVFML